MAYQSLYRRYRPGRFSEIVGQEHVIAAVRNAVRDERVGHAYLFSGPRGTGKTSTARILAKALNCENLSEGEPCNECSSCEAFIAGGSYDLHELDAASNNKVDDVRDLIGKVALGSPGRTKVYVLDEVHMLTPGAENALLKTLEEPPDHVVFVLATTEPQKVVATIRSRTQHLNFELLPADLLAEHVRWIIDDAGLEVGPEAVDFVVAAGGGSARDTLSALDQVVAAGGIPDATDVVGELIEALCERDTGRVLNAVNEAVRLGRDPRTIAEALVAEVRDAFLSAMRADLSHLSDAQREAAQERAGRLGAPGCTRALELIGAALVEMRQAPDPRIDFEVALVRLTRPELDTDPAALVERIERLERGKPPADSSPAASAPPAATAPTASSPQRTPKPTSGSPAAAARAVLAKESGSKEASSPKKESSAKKAASEEPPPAEPASAEPTAAEPTAAEPASAEPVTEPAPASGGGLPSRDEVALAWGDHILGSLSSKARTRYAGGRFLSGDGDALRFALPNAIHRDRCLELRGEVDQALAAHFGQKIELELVVEDASAKTQAEAPTDVAATPPEDEIIDVSSLDDATDANETTLDRLTEAFPGSELVEVEDE
jgi:DNA polymerase-3 subunit gamma/tau